MECAAGGLRRLLGVRLITRGSGRTASPLARQTPHGVDVCSQEACPQEFDLCRVTGSLR
jgi:hypothetical protein